MKQVEVRLKLSAIGKAVYKKPINSPEIATEFMGSEMRSYSNERVAVIFLDNQLNPMCYSVISAGNIDECIVPVTEIFKTALLSNAAMIILLHNHPSGNVTPSAYDDQVTQRVKQAGEIIGIHLIDHIIVGAGKGRTYSYKESGKL